MVENHQFIGVLDAIIKATFNKPEDLDYEEGSCVIWGFGFTQWLEQAYGLSGIPFTLYGPEDDAQEFPQFCEHCTVYIPKLDMTFDWRGSNAKSRWTNPGVWRESQWSKVILDPLDEHINVFCRLCDQST